MTQTRFAKPHTIRGEASVRLMEDIDANFDALFKALAAAGIGGGSVGPQGPAGPAGADGADGADGQDGQDYTPEIPLLEVHGGTGRDTFDEGDLLVGTAAGDLDILPHGNEDQVLTTKSGNLSWEDPPEGAEPHALLSATHDDTTAAAPTRGDVIAAIGATPKWTRVAKGDPGQVLTMGADEPTWDDPAGGEETDPIFALIGRYGFVSATSETTIALAAVGDGTYRFTLGSVGPTWRYFRNGVLCTITGSKTVILAGTIPPTTGNHWIYIDSEDGALVDGPAWTLLDTKVPVAVIIFDDTLTPKYWMANEQHSCLIDRRVHYYEHFTEGTRLLSGGTVSGQTVGGSTDPTLTFGISGASLEDEDLLYSNLALTDPNAGESSYVMWYRTAAAVWKWKTSTMPFDWTAAGYIKYDLNGTQTQGQNNKWYNTYLLITHINGEARWSMISGRAEFGSLAAAQVEDVAAFAMSGLAIVEFVVAYRFTWHTSSSFTTTGKVELAATPQRINVPNVQAVVGGGSTDHNSLSNLQGGDVTERYHLTALQHGGQWDALGAGVAVEAGSKLKIGGHTYIVQYDAGNSGAAKTIDWQNGNEQILTLTADCTLTFTNGKAGGRYVILFTQDGVGGWLVTWPAGTVWSGGIEAILDADPAGLSLVAFYYNGTNWVAAGMNASAAAQGMPEIPLAVLHGGTGRTAIADGELFAGDVDAGMSAVPAPTVSGQVLTANTGISRKMEWSSSPLSRANAAVYLSSDTVANDGVELQIEFDAESWDTFGMHDNGVNPKRVTIPSGYAGVYVISAGIGWGASGAATGTLWTRLYRNGSLCFQTTNPLSYLYDANAVSAWVMSLEEGDYLELRCYHKVGITLAVQGGTYKTFIRLAQVA